jgi:hypothetical protein
MLKEKSQELHARSKKFSEENSKYYFYS